MKFIRQYGIIISVFVLVLALVLARTFNKRQFRYDAVRWAEVSADGSNLINEDQLEKMTGSRLVVWLGEETAEETLTGYMRVSMKPGSVLEKQNLKLIRRNKGPVILYSEDISVSARIWMLLSEMGIKNLYILAGSMDNN